MQLFQSSSKLHGVILGTTILLHHTLPIAAAFGSFSLALMTLPFLASNMGPVEDATKGSETRTLKPGVYCSVDLGIATTNFNASVDVKGLHDCLESYNTTDWDGKNCGGAGWFKGQQDIYKDPQYCFAMCHDCLDKGINQDMLGAKCFHKTKNLPVCWMGYELPAIYTLPPPVPDNSTSPSEGAPFVG